MRTFGHGAFENDHAREWVWKLKVADDPSALDTALRAVVEDEPECLDVRTCCRALVAAEIVAALHGRPSADLPEDLAAWLVARPAPDALQLQRTREAVAAIVIASGAKELWADAEDPGEWRAVTADLQERLAE